MLSGLKKKSIDSSPVIDGLKAIPDYIVDCCQLARGAFKVKISFNIKEMNARIPG